MKFSGSKLLKQVAILTLLVGFFPVISLMTTFLVWEAETIEILPILGLILISGYSGYLGRYLNTLLAKYTKHLFIRYGLLLIYYGLILGGVIRGLAVYSAEYPVLLLSFVILAGIACYMLIKSYDEEDLQILSWPRCAFIMATGIAASLFMPHFLITAVVISSICIFAFLRNQTIIGELLDRTEENVSRQAKNRITFQITIMFLCLIIGAFLLYSMSKDVGEVLGAVLKSIVSIVIYGFNLLLQLFRGTAHVEGINHIPIPVEAIEEEGIRLGLLVMGLISLIILCCAIRYRKEILSKIIYTTSTFLMYFKHFIYNAFKANTQKTVQHATYYDQLESIDIVTRNRDVEQALSLKKWKRSIRQYWKQQNTNLKYYKGYGLIRQWLQLKHIEILISDTPFEIYNKADHFKEVIPLDTVTKTYNRIKYGEHQLMPEDFRVLDEVLRQIVHIG